MQLLQSLQNIHTLATIIGLLGVALLLTAYFLLQASKLTTRGIGFSVYNLIGSCLILFSLYFHWNLPSVVIEIAWISISVYGIARILLTHKK